MSAFRKRLLAAGAAWVLALSVRAHAAAPPAGPGVPSRVLLEFFYEEGCSDCERVKQEVLPFVEASYPDQLQVEHLGIGVASNYVRLTRYFDRFGTTRNEHVFMAVNRSALLAGFDEISQRLAPAIEQGLLASPAAAAAAAAGDPAGLLAERLRRFTLFGVVMAALADGINPCAISTLVFLVSVLTMAKARGGHILRMGGAFCAATFITYTAIGLGLLGALHRLEQFPAVRAAVEHVLIAALLLLSLLSFRDAFRYRASQDAKDITLQLPARIRNTIHRLLRQGIGEKAQITGSFAIGILVTGLESVCTGQMYVPTLALIVKSGSRSAEALLLLLLYNAIFVLPLVLVLALTWRGLQLKRVIDWSARNVFVSKLLLGSLFFALALTFFLLRM